MGCKRTSVLLECLSVECFLVDCYVESEKNCSYDCSVTSSFLCHKNNFQFIFLRVAKRLCIPPTETDIVCCFWFGFAIVCVSSFVGLKPEVTHFSFHIRGRKKQHKIDYRIWARRTHIKWWASVWCGFTLINVNRHTLFAPQRSNLCV